MAHTEQCGIISVDDRRSTAQWRTVREGSSVGGDAWTLPLQGTPDLPHQEVTK